jgi:inorganic triphosphatase YgiF
VDPDSPQTSGPAPSASVPAKPREVELKLLLEPADLHPLRRHRRVRELAVSRPSSRRLRSVYFDTPSLELLQRGITLRVRRVGRRHVQTVKLPAGGGAGLLERTEIECPVAGETPDPARIPHPGLRAVVLQVAAADGFGAILETEVQRTERQLRVEDSLLRFDLDVGEIRTPRGTAPICELELELEQGDPYRLYELASELQQSVRLRVSTRSKFQRGIELLTGAHPTPQRAERVRLDRDATLEQAMEESLRGCFDQILSNEEPARRGVDPEGVHQMRVGVRRLRSGMSLFAGVLPREQLQPLREDLRWLGEELGRARDLDVFTEESLGGLRRRFPEDPELKRLHDEATLVHAEAYVSVRACLDSLRYAELMLRLGRWLTGREWRQQPTSPASARLFQPARGAASALLARRYKRLRRRGRDLPRKGEQEKHALRIEAKKLRYAAEFLRGLFPGRGAGRFIRATARLQETLGHLNDARTARRMLLELQGRLAGEAPRELTRSTGFVEGWISRAAEDELLGLDRRWASLRSRRPFWDRAG